MVRGAAGLASVLGAHVTSRGEPPAAAAPLAPQPSGAISPIPPAAALAGTPSPVPLAPAPVALAAPHSSAPAAHTGSETDSADADQLATAATAATQPGPLTAADRADADAVYDALESRLRAEFLRTYGSYGA